MLTIEKVISGIECHKEVACSECPYKTCTCEDGRICDELMNDALSCLQKYYHVLHLARAMHTWIFLHTADEFAVYDELGLTDEDNALLGSIGGPIVIEGRGVENNER